MQLLHFAGDSHQPLHNMVLFNSQFPDGDRGGNGFAIKPIADIRELHAFWDDMGAAYPNTRWYDKNAQTQINADVKDLNSYVQSHTPPASIARIPLIPLPFSNMRYEHGFSGFETRRSDES